MIPNTLKGIAPLVLVFLSDRNNDMEQDVRVVVLFQVLGQSLLLNLR